MKGKTVRSFLQRAMLLWCGLLSVSALAFPEIPKESAKALGQTRGKPFSSGAVFVNGKYVEPPYVIIRWGTGIRIKAGQDVYQVTGQVVDWGEFLKTQDGVKVEKTEESDVAAAPVAAPALVAAPVAAVADVDESSLDDLFDDDPKPKKKSPPPVAAPVVPTPTVAAVPVRPVVPRVKTTYTLEGAFVKNDAAKVLLNKVNAARTEIDRILRGGGFICFGDSYSRVVGDSRTLLGMLDTLPELQQHSSDVQSFIAGVRAARMVYLNEVLCADLFRNRVDYRKLKDRRVQLQKDRELKDMIKNISTPLF